MGISTLVKPNVVGSVRVLGSGRWFLKPCTVLSRKTLEELLCADSEREGIGAWSKMILNLIKLAAEGRFIPFVYYCHQLDTVPCSSVVESYQVLLYRASVCQFKSMA